MKPTLQQAFSITRLTALEASRQPVFLLLMTTSLAFIGLLPFLVTHVLSDSARMVRDSALAVQLVAGLTLACFAASATLARELRQGTLAAILSKPVDRSVFFLAKFAGVALVMLVFSGTATLATMLSTRTAAEPFVFDLWGSGPLMTALGLAYGIAGLQNYFTRQPFVSRAFGLMAVAVAAAFLVSCFIAAPDTAATYFGSALPWNILPAGLLLALAMLLLSALAVALATRMELTAAVSIGLGLLLLGMMSDYLFGRHAADHALYALAYHIVPNWQHFWAVDALHDGSIPWSYVATAAAYTAAYTTAALAAGLLVFRRVEVR